MGVEKPGSGGPLDGGTEGSAGLTGFFEHVPVPVFEHVPVPTMMVLLGIDNQSHDDQNHCNASGYDVLHWSTPEQTVIG